MRIGILALQGAFIEHRKLLERIGADHFEVRQLRDLNGPMDGLILPGGESTVMGKLLRDLSLLAPLRSLIRKGLPVMGTCAGLLLLAKEITNSEARHFETMDIHAVRNAYGRQLGSFHTAAPFADNGNIPMAFIRAPYIKAVGKGVEILSEVDDKIVAARQGNQLATAFHPELGEDTSVHEYFLNMIR